MPHKPDGNYIAEQSNENGDQYSQGRGNTKMAMLRVTGVTADTGYMLVDLSDSTNFPHTATGRIRLYSLTMSGSLKGTAGAGKGYLYFGVITEVDATNGSVDWFYVLDLQVYDNADDDSIRIDIQKHWPGGLDLEVDVSGETSDNLITATVDTGDTVWQTDVNLASPYTSDSPSGQGDLVAFWDETEDGATLNLCILVEYITQAVTAS